MVEKANHQIILILFCIKYFSKKTLPLLILLPHYPEIAVMKDEVQTSRNFQFFYRTCGLQDSLLEWVCTVHPKPSSAFGNSSGIPAACEPCLLDVMIIVSHNIKLLVAAWSYEHQCSSSLGKMYCTICQKRHKICEPQINSWGCVAAPAGQSQLHWPCPGVVEVKEIWILCTQKVQSTHKQPFFLCPD